jgi:hypothetical protein
VCWRSRGYGGLPSLDQQRGGEGRRISLPGMSFGIVARRAPDLVPGPKTVGITLFRSPCPRLAILIALRVRLASDATPV